MEHKQKSCDSSLSAQVDDGMLKMGLVRCCVANSEACGFVFTCTIRTRPQTSSSVCTDLNLHVESLCGLGRGQAERERNRADPHVFSPPLLTGS